MPHARRFRFGVDLSGPLPGLSWADTVRRIEDLGFSTVFVPDHFDEQYGPFTALASAAAASPTITLGTLVLDNDYRHPVVTAKEVATLDVVSEGRVELGVGAGWKKIDYDQSGIPMDRPKVRVDRMIEGIEVMRRAFGDGAFDFAGEHYTITGYDGLPKPHRAGGPPLLIGGGAPRMLRWAGANADIVGVNPSIHSGEIDLEAARDGLSERIDQKVAWVKEGAGDRFADLEINAWVPVVEVTEDSAAYAEAASPLFDTTPAELLASPMTMIGSPSEIAERLQARRERWGYSYHVVQAPSVEALAPVVAALSGT
jgi:probable F420-dependent oxidoreductase